MIFVINKSPIWGIFYRSFSRRFAIARPAPPIAIAPAMPPSAIAPYVAYGDAK
jgi:hypothetical protein